jgi:hypothetical protein
VITEGTDIVVEWYRPGAPWEETAMASVDAVTGDEVTLSLGYPWEASPGDVLWLDGERFAQVAVCETRAGGCTITVVLDEEEAE